MALKSLKDLYIDELQDLYSSEEQELGALQNMENAAGKPELKAAFGRHLDQTREQKARLGRILQDLGSTAGGKECVGMRGLIEEGKALIRDKALPSVKDAGLISTAQRIEHYEMAGYGTVRTLAQMLGYAEAALSLQQTLDEEGDANRELSQIAISIVDADANSEHPRIGKSDYRD